ncbi:hypothetical protein HDR60_03380 [bacterium]|nr:hypothetical protein [bacterium]
MKISIFVLALILSSQVMASNNSRVLSKSISNRSLRGNATATTTTTTITEDKTKEQCEQIFYDCMDKKTNETVMQYEVYYDDYNDMLSDIYNGMSSPVFKCIYSNDIKDLYSSYYYGQTGLDVDGNTVKIKKNSIAYYNFLKQNASDVASKKISANMVLPEVLNIAGITKTPIDSKAQTTPNVSYKFTTVVPLTLFNLNKEYCMDVEKNKDLDGCAKLKNNLADNWKNLTPNTMSKSCQDYETFLIDKRTQAQQATQTFILSLKTQIINAIDEYNAKIEASKQLF